MTAGSSDCITRKTSKFTFGSLTASTRPDERQFSLNDWRPCWLESVQQSAATAEYVFAPRPLARAP